MVFFELLHVVPSFIRSFFLVHYPNRTPTCYVVSIFFSIILIKPQYTKVVSISFSLSLSDTNIP